MPTARFLRVVADCVGGGRFATLARCLAGISETEARSLGALAVAKPLDGCGWLGVMMNSNV
jgi:hypothetical protein